MQAFRTRRVHRIAGPALLTAALLTAALIAAAGSAGEGAAAEPASHAKYWIFLVTGLPTTDVPQEELRAKQAAHLENFGRLAKANQLLAAGPLRDPDRRLRGIVVVQAARAEQIPAYFEPDPYISEGFMCLETHRIVDQVGDTFLPPDDAGLEEVRIVIWSYPDSTDDKPAITADLLEQHTKYWQAQRAAGRLALRCRFGEGESRFGVALLTKAPDEQLADWLAQDPLVAARAVAYQVLPQFLAQGAVKFVPQN